MIAINVKLKIIHVFDSIPPETCFGVWRPLVAHFTCESRNKSKSHFYGIILFNIRLNVN